MMFQNCLAYLDQEGAVRCGLPAEVRCRFTMRSADSSLESAMIRRPAGHSFSGPIESPPQTAPATTIRALPDSAPAGRTSLQGGRDGRRVRDDRRGNARVRRSRTAFLAPCTVSGTVVLALVILVTAGSYGAGNDNLSDLLLFAAGVAVLPAWLIWTGRVSGTGDAFPDPR